MNISPDILPPILPNIVDQLKDYILCPEKLPIHNYENNQEFWPCKSDVTNIFEVHRNQQLATNLMVRRDPNTGKLTEFYEISVAEAGSTAKNSMSLHRAPTTALESVRGDPSNFPFWPGGIPMPEINIEEKNDDNSELLTVPPSFNRGLIFASDGCTVINENADQIPENKAPRGDFTERKVNLMELVQKEQDIFDLWKDIKPVSNVEKKISDVSKPDIDETEVIPKEQDIPVLKLTETRQVKDYKWAVMIDIQKPVENFRDKIPEMAHEYPFKLDNFQEQAILKLEENCDVFVAAHTSAGKTVVAEYAIALSQKHKTRTIYTSPIKALSNQKYRDFKHTFKDVGLITGDFQINQTATCLIMTTEILRSMLYGGSEVIRDLEYAIFDEVHYINDAERGHVWEEVLILLPSHVRIVLLSATVPNTLEFASWLGFTKKRKVYVISTLQRPVPLQHYIYTGTDGKSRDERYLILDDKGNFKLDGHMEATKAVNKHLESSKNKFVNKGKDRGGQDERSWSGLIDHLKRNDLLPVVVFTFSRAQCDRNAESLRFKNYDLTSKEEKSKIHSFYQKCIKHLKEPDRELPQIISMQQSLKNGVGVHHSGVLPIVKEIVEMLFQSGLVKILFATETFAMGVNMPARTVIFNGIEKFDGKEKRFLKPAEYIQMAGRAGRRGLDKTGTVIIKCQNSIPGVLILKAMMQGKPQKLESQFRLTYGMLLTLLRVESLSIESMMTHSFHEVNHVTRADQLKIDLKKAEEELALESQKEIGDYSQNLCTYYDYCSEYIKLWDSVQPKIMQQQKVCKELIPGRVLIINHKKHFNKLALLLSINLKKESTLKVLVLSDQKKQSDEIEFSINENKLDTTQKKSEDINDNWYRIISFAYDEIFQPHGVGGHDLLEIPITHITKITTKLIKIDTDLVIKDCEKRQIPRFRDDPPSQTCSQAIQELTKLTHSVLTESKITCFTYADFHINDIDLVEEINNLETVRAQFNSFISYTKIANFEEKFAVVYKRKCLQEKVDYLKHMISHRSLTLYPEYLCRINVLKDLNYIDDQNQVGLKGNVALRMGMNELLITELVLRNKLSDLQPAEVAGLLSALVFQAKSDIEPELTESLKKGKKEIEEIYDEIEKIEHKYQIKSSESTLNFKLVQVVYEWAKDKPFADIMKLTDIQEGIIVRCIQQLNETLKDVKEAAGIIGDTVLQTKMDEVLNAIKRDIVFAASLYTQKEAAMISV